MTSHQILGRNSTQKKTDLSEFKKIMMKYMKMSGRHLAEIASESSLSSTKGGVLGIVFN